MFQPGKLAIVYLELERLNISVLEIGDVRWTVSGEVQYGKSEFI